jgi:SAM-dependent methyltransferase
MRAITASILGGRLKDTENLSLLDVGCGTGYSLGWLKNRLGARFAAGIDLSVHAASFWKRRGLDQNAIASAASLPFASSQFDLVTCFDVIYQFETEQARAALSEISRVLKPGGLLYLREPAYSWMRGGHDVAVSTKHRYTKTGLCGLVREAGLLPARSTYANTLLFWAAAPHRLLSRLRGETESDVKPVAGWLNGLLGATLKLEARLLAKARFPFGLSVIVLAQKSLD